MKKMSDELWQRKVKEYAITMGKAWENSFYAYILRGSKNKLEWEKYNEKNNTK